MAGCSGALTVLCAWQQGVCKSLAGEQHFRLTSVPLSRCLLLCSLIGSDRASDPELGSRQGLRLGSALMLQCIMTGQAALASVIVFGDMSVWLSSADCCKAVPSKPASWVSVREFPTCTMYARTVKDGSCVGHVFDQSVTGRVASTMLSLHCCCVQVLRHSSSDIEAKSATMQAQFLLPMLVIWAVTPLPSPVLLQPLSTVTHTLFQAAFPCQPTAAHISGPMRL